MAWSRAAKNLEKTGLQPLMEYIRIIEDIFETRSSERSSQLVSLRMIASMCVLAPIEVGKIRVCGIKDE